MQVPLAEAVKSVVDQLRTITKAGNFMHVSKVTEERSFNTFIFVAVKLPKEEVAKALEMVSQHECPLCHVCNVNS